MGSFNRSISIVTPSPLSLNGGNGRTAERYADLLAEAGYQVEILLPDAKPRGDILVALHARRSIEAIRNFRKIHPLGGCAVVLTGTDLYQDLPKGDPAVFESLRTADFLVGLHRGVSSDLPMEFRNKLRVLVQSALPPREKRRPERAKPESLVVLVPCNLRAVKNPLFPAQASRLLPRESRIQVFLMGEELEEGWADKARNEEHENPRFCWIGGKPKATALELIAGSDVLVIPSKSEGAANVLSEAIASGTPILASKIPGNVGILGAEPGPYFPVGDKEALATLLLRFERNSDFRKQLKSRVQALQGMVSPQKEREGLVALIQDLE